MGFWYVVLIQCCFIQFYLSLKFVLKNQVKIILRVEIVSIKTQFWVIFYDLSTIHFFDPYFCFFCLCIVNSNDLLEFSFSDLFRVSFCFISSLAVFMGLFFFSVVQMALKGNYCLPWYFETWFWYSGLNLSFFKVIKIKVCKI